MHSEPAWTAGAVPRRYLALTLPRWATDCLKRHDKTLDGLTAPLVLYARLQNAMRLVALDERAEQVGLAPGQMLSDARAICPALVAREIDRDFLADVFGALADWHTNLSPIVAIADDREVFGDLVIDITGAAHLFGGEAKMLALATGRLESFGFTVQGAIAGSVGAALALARFVPGQVVTGAPDAALTLLPVAALRLDDEQIAGLMQAGLKTIGQLYGRDRGALQARFGPSLLVRLDQALGRAAERLTPRLPVPDYFADRKFAEPIGAVDDVIGTAKDLAHKLSGDLYAAGLGAQTFHLILYRADHKMMHLAVNAARATREAGHIARLFANRIDRLTQEIDTGFGIEMIRLMATSVTGLDETQTGVFGAPDGAADLDLLVDRLTSRLGPAAAMRPVFVNTHIPERAVMLAPAVAPPNPGPLAQPEDGPHRPLRLLPRPEEIAVVAEVPDGPPARAEWRRQSYRFVRTAGPERIAMEWWHPGEVDLTRDYFLCETEAGLRLWLFRSGLFGVETMRPRWFMHGICA